MFNDMVQIESNDGNKYCISLQGVLNSPTIDWFGDVTVTPQGHGKILLVSLLVDQNALRSFLDQFLNLNFTVQPIEVIENEITDVVNA